MSLPLFDLAPRPAEPPHSDVGSDVILRAEHKAGPFRHLKGGVVDREYQIVVTMDGRVWAEFTDNAERRPAIGLPREWVDEFLRKREWREVVEGLED